MGPQKLNILSFMSGSSLDGMDIGIIEIAKNAATFTYNIHIAETMPYSLFWAKALKDLSDLPSEKLIELDFAYADYCAHEINKFCLKYKMTVDLISFHGHTVFHKPSKGYTYSLGNLSALSAKTKKQVLGNFRDRDVALGGQGAPLMGVADELLFSHFALNINLGGICNISLNGTNPIAFDICPCNQLLNTVYNEIGIEYDNHGKIASRGNINEQLLEKLNRDKYYNSNPPKSLDNNYIKKHIIPLLLVDVPPANKLNTIIEFVSQQIFNNVSRLFKKSQISSNDKVLITGGGAHNTFLIEKLENKLSVFQVKIEKVPNELIDFKELILMALLAFLRKNNEYNVLKKFTGSSHDSISGGIYG